MVIIDIDGPSAVGKTTLISRLHRALPDFRPVEELLARTPNPYGNWSTPEEFLQKQLWFFENTLRRYDLPDVSRSPEVPGVQVNDIGVLDVILHTAAYPCANGLSWNMFPEFQQAVMSRWPNRLLANLIFFLSASPETLRRRMEQDTGRRRGAFASNLKLVPFQNRFYASLSSAFPEQVVFLDTEALTQEELARLVLERIHRAQGLDGIRLYEVLEAAGSL